MSTSGDIVKHSMALWMQRKEKGHSCAYVGSAILFGVVIIAAQFYLLYELNSKCGTSLFCGDIIKMIQTEGDPDQLFTDYVPEIYQVKWEDIAEEMENEDTTFEQRQSDEYEQFFTYLKWKFINKIARGWSSDWFPQIKSPTINNKYCSAPRKSKSSFDVTRALEITVKDLRRSGITEVTEEDLEEAQEMIKKYKKWQCPKDYTKGNKCELKWDCTIEEWTTWCNDQIGFATRVPNELKFTWVLALVILAATVTQDLQEHLLFMRQAPPFFKVLLMLQCVIAVNLCIINASLTAGSKNSVDILLNSVALLCVNDMDNIIGRFFLIQSDLSEDQEGDPIAEQISYHDRVFARWLATPHFLYVCYYGSNFLDAFAFHQPFDGLLIITYVQPYSIFIFPFVLTLWYIFCYSKCCGCLRCAWCFREPQSVKQKDDEPDENVLVTETERPINGGQENDIEMTERTQVAAQENGPNIWLGYGAYNRRYQSSEKNLAILH